MTSRIPCLIVFFPQINKRRYSLVITVYQNLQIFVDSWRFLHLKIMHLSESTSLKEYLAIMHFISFYLLSLLPKILLKSTLSCSHYMSSLQCLSYTPPGDLKVRLKNGKYFQFSKSSVALPLNLRTIPFYLTNNKHNIAEVGELLSQW